jgi:hypothetical protein
VTEPLHNPLVSAPMVGTIDEAECWIAILHRRTVEDAERMNTIEARLRRLERPWWRRWRNS